MKALARSYVFWPRIDSDIEQMAAACDACKRGKTTTGVRVSIQPWEYPGGAWQRVHADFFDWEKNKFLIIVDAFSKWIGVFVMTTTTAEATISKMRECFARFGLPVTLVTDNGPPWKSDEFQDFLSTNGIKHLTSAPYFPQSQGQVERYVATVKQGLKIVAENESITTRLNNLLMAYRKTPHSVTGQSPAMLMLKRNLRTRIDLLLPRIPGGETTWAEKKIFTAYERGDPVWFKQFHQGEQKWIEGIVEKRMGRVMYLVREKLSKAIHKRHVNQTKPRVTKESLPSDSPELAIAAGEQPSTTSQGTVPLPRRSERIRNRSK